MHTNGGDGRSGPIPHRGARGEGMGVPTGGWAAIFATGGKSTKAANQKEQQQTSKGKRKQRGNSPTKALTTGGL